MAMKENRKQMAESRTLMDQLERYSLEQQRSIIKKKLKEIGTDCTTNDDDPTGNGDQSLIQSDAGREKAREIYSIGGDINKHMTESAMSIFAIGCFTGIVETVLSQIENVTKNIKQPFSRRNEMKTLLETRETSLRLSPLLLIVSAGKNVVEQPFMDHTGVAKVLLKHGASPDAKDVLGKTACHYGAGAFATSMSLEVVDMCIRASNSSQFYGKEVELCGLKKIDMNGAKGVVGGFDPDSDRRAVYLSEGDKEVWVKPINICILGSNNNVTENPMLADVQDRLGTVSLHEVIIMDREDVATFLLHKHNTSIHTEGLDGMSPLKMSTSGGEMASNVCKLINHVAKKNAGKVRNAKKFATKYACAACKKDLPTLYSTCSGCNVVIYCNRDCQLFHWKNGHKKECAKLKAYSTGVELERPDSSLKHASISMVSGMTHLAGTYHIPDDIDPDEKFVIKVQGGSDHMPIMVYDESRTCMFDINPGKPGFKEVLNEMKKEKAWNGRKTFMKASFDELGNCTVFPATAGVKEKYSW